ncbi:MAG: hypothetical protein A2252_05900 [Elusimicrobia bacterium RIFOXYA2_FULL_39_19]|nr:MAG: hypothetical protein A2252_05900 [Elusimicrobia bacterium RIFOXYA2_FULL_39_19]
MKNSIFYKYAELVLKLLPFVSQEKGFALKGGTAINLFVRDLPRLSVDIDLTYMPLKSREETLHNIKEALRRISKTAQRNIPRLTINENLQGKEEYKIFVRTNDVQVKIEPNLIFRGSVFPVEKLTLSKKAQEIFEMFVSVQSLSIADLYGSKLCAALDRQHPRDLFDIKILLEKEGITQDIKKAFIVYLISHNRPIHELLNPRFQDFKEVYLAEFENMTSEKVSYKDLLAIQRALPGKIIKILSDKDKSFILSVKKGNPEWELLGIEGVDKLPGIRWKLININNMPKQKHIEYTKKLERIFET